MPGALLLAAMIVGRPYAGTEAVEVGSKPVVVFDIEVPKLVDEPRGELGGVAWAPDGSSLWVGAGSMLYRLAADDGAVIWRTPVPDDDGIDALVMSPKGTHLAATTRDDHVMVWSTSGTVTMRVERPGWMLDDLVAFSPDGKRVFAALYTADPDVEEVIRIEAWDVATGRSLADKEVRRLEYAAVTGATGFALSPDGSQVAIGLLETWKQRDIRQYLLLWRPFAVTGRRLLTLQIPR